MLARFQIEHQGTTIGREIRAGSATFLTMAYILAVNPQILSSAGMPAEDVVTATAIASAVACLVMGWWANLPFGLAPGMGLNAYFAFTVVGAMGIPWQQALAAVFIEGLLFLVLSLSGARTALIDAVPDGLKRGIMVGIGLFLAMIGLQNAGLVVDDPATLVTLGPLQAPALWALVGVVGLTALLVRRVPGAMLITILGLSAVAWVGGLAPAPETWAAAPRLPRETWLALDFSQVFSLSMLTVILAFFFVDLLDTAGTLIGVGHAAGFVDEEGRLENADQAFAADAVGTSVGALLGTSTVTTYIESAAGTEEGGRTGLTAVTVGALFLLSLVFAPIFVAIPAFATAPVLVVLGALMMRGAAAVEWQKLEDAVPAFLTLITMPLTYSIADGIAVGVVSWVVIRLLIGEGRRIPVLLAVLALLAGLWYGLAH